MGWKQPIDTDIYKWFGDDHLARDLFIHLLLKARNKDMLTPEYYKKKPFKLNRGQVIFGRNEYSEKLRVSPMTAKHALDRLEKWYKKLASKSTSDFTVITILNFNDLVGLEQATIQAVSKQLASDEQAISTNKSVKSDKNKKDLLLFKKEGSFKDLFLSLNKKIHPKRLCIETNGHLSKIKARLKNFTEKEIILAADNMLANPFMMGDNENNRKYATLEYLIRNDEHIRKWLEEAPGKISRLMKNLDVDNLED